jgi:hypothetical protein
MGELSFHLQASYFRVWALGHAVEKSSEEMERKLKILTVLKA